MLVTGYDLVCRARRRLRRLRARARGLGRAGPGGLSSFDVMAIGTAGFTAALSVVEMERNGLAPANGPVIVTGATGGVGSLAVQILAVRGYQVTALTGRTASMITCGALGARRLFLARNGLQMGTRPLEKATWAAPWTWSAARRSPG